MAPFTCTFMLEKVLNILKSSGSSYTISPDGFPVYLLSKLAGELAEPIDTLFIIYTSLSDNLAWESNLR